MRYRVGLALVMVLSLVLSGCFGFLKPDKELAKLELNAAKNMIEPGDANTLTVDGKAEDDSTVAVELTADAWKLVTEGAGKLEAKADNPNQAVFTAAEDFTGDVKVEVKLNDLNADVTFKVVVTEVKGVKAGDLKEQDGYQDSPNKDDHNGVRIVEDDQRGYAPGTVFTHWNWPGHWIKWEIEDVKAGEYALVLRYATSSAEEFTKRTLKVNGEEVRGADNPIELPTTGGFAGGGAVGDWSYQVVPGIKIEQDGKVELILTHAGTLGERKGTNLAYLALVSPAEFPIDDSFLLRIEKAIGVERTEGMWD